MTPTLFGHAPQASDLRPYQSRFVDRLRASMREGYRRVLGTAPTGAGKTVCAAHIIAAAVARDSGIVFLAHRKELIDQTSRKLDDLCVPHGIVMADHPRHQPWERVQVASIQTLARRQLAFEPDLVFVDEAHHARAQSYETLLARWPRARMLGLTATPWRQDGRGLGELWQTNVVAATPRELQEQGYLCPCVGFAYERPDLSDVRTTAGDYNEEDLGRVMGKTELLGNLLGMWHQHAGGTRTVIFAVHLEHSRAILREFSEARHHGAPICRAEHLDGTTPKHQREAILRRIDQGETLVVSNVGVLTEGWDCPRVETLLLARPTKSVTLYLQMVGRAARPVCRACGRATSSTAESCRHCGSLDVKRTYRLHDHAGAVMMHGLPDQDRDYSLRSDLRQKTKGEPTENLSVRICRQCLALFSATLEACPQCGAEVEKRERRVVEIRDARPVPLEEAGRRFQASDEGKRREYERLRRVGAMKGYKPGWAANVFRAKFGHWPRYEVGNG